MTNIGRRRRQNPDMHGYMIDVTTGRWLKENEREDQAAPEEEGLEAPGGVKRKQRVIPYVEDRRNILVTRLSAAVSPETAVTAAIALERGIEAAFQLEDSELSSEELPDQDRRGRALFVESAEGGAGALRRLVDDPDALPKAARTALQIMHFDPDTGADTSGDEPGTGQERCVRACYDCLLSYGNQRVHEHDRPAPGPRPDAQARLRHGGTPSDTAAGPPVQHRAGEPAGRRVRGLAASRDLRLPDDDRQRSRRHPPGPDLPPAGRERGRLRIGPATGDDEPEAGMRTPAMCSAISAGASSPSGPAPTGPRWRPATRACSAHNDGGDTVTTTELPAFEVGALVQARGREWVVLPQSEPPGFLVLRPLGGGDDEVAGVFPALEQVSPATFEAPDPGDAGTAVSAGLLRTALRIGFRASAGPFRSLARLAVEPRAYQLVPLLMALRQDTVRLLIADDVGIGKTIEAGLIAAELLEQGDATGLAVLCGPALAEQWQRELASKFGIHAELVLPGTIRRLERGLLQGETLFDRYPHIVVSTDFIKRPGLREQFWHGCPDLLIIDEAHTCVSDGTGGRSRMLRHELVKRPGQGRRAAPDPGHRDPAQRQGGGFPQPAGPAAARTSNTWTSNRSQGRERLARHFVQRRRADIRAYIDESTPFPEDRLTQERPYALSRPYKELFDDVLQYARETVRDPEGGQLRQRVRYWSALALLRALASSPRGGGRHPAHPGGQPRRARTRPKPTGSAAPPCSTCPTRRPSSQPTPPPAPTATPPTARPPHRRRLRRFAARASQPRRPGRHQAQAARPRPSPSCCSTASTRSCSAVSSTPPNTSPSTWRSASARTTRSPPSPACCRPTSAKPGSGTWPPTRNAARCWSRPTACPKA